MCNMQGLGLEQKRNAWLHSSRRLSTHRIIVVPEYVHKAHA